MPTQAERRAATRRKILDAAGRLFARDGYEATTTARILEEASVSRGAMYHQFAAKEDVFAAVYEAVSAEALAGAARDGRQRDDARDALVRGCLAWLREVCRPEVARILFDLGPSALGWERCRAIEDRYSLRLVRRSVEAAIAAGARPPMPVETVARVLNAALGELALTTIHATPGEAPSDAAIARTVEAMIGALVPYGATT